MAVINKKKYETFPNRKNLEDLAKEKENVVHFRC